MSELGDVIGAFMASLAQARRIADEETVAIAELYRRTPLLEGLSVPRMRVPEVAIDLPVVVEECSDGSVGQELPTAEIVKRLQKTLQSSAKLADVTLTKRFIDRFSRELRKELARQKPSKTKSRSRLSAEGLTKAVDVAWQQALASDRVGRLSEEQAITVGNSLRRESRAIGVEHGGQPPLLEVTVLTSEVKERTSPDNVTRLRFTLREEGLEWSTVEFDDGRKGRILTPE